MTSSVCTDCGHAWKVHPGALVSVTVCAACIHEEDIGTREEADMCSRVPPDMEHVPAGRSPVARHKRRPLRGDRVSVESHTGARWALLRPPVAGRVHVERLTLQVQEDLATMPIAQFRQKYREFTE